MTESKHRNFEAETLDALSLRRQPKPAAQPAATPGRSGRPRKTGLNEDQRQDIVLHLIDYFKSDPKGLD